MRRILIDHARKRRASKRAGAYPPPAQTQSTAHYIDVLEIDRAISKLAGDYPRHANIVELKFFGGLDAGEIARVLSLSLRTVERDWHFAKAWLQNEVSGF
jgi:RNA polymerase sigma factor (TIGR02999 family)